jgi:hypothetical protein
MKERVAGKRYCGNCSSHNTFEYPGVMFCMARYLKGKKAITPTLSVCGEWRPHVQKCFCVEDALKKKAEK